MQQTHAKLPINPPFFYGWVIVGCAISVGIPRAILGASILGALIGPMSDDLGWNRTTISGVLTTGALVATVTAPVAGRLVDRYGSRVILSGSSLLMGAFALLLSFAVTPLMFYIPFTLGRALFVGPMEVGMSTTVSNWFIRRRPQALAAVSATSPIGLAIFPPMAGAIAAAADWRTAWLALGMCMLGDRRHPVGHLHAPPARGRWPSPRRRRRAYHPRARPQQARPGPHRQRRPTSRYARRCAPPPCG